MGKRIALFITLIAVIITLCVSACRHSHSPAPVAGSFPDSIAKIIVSNCATAGCHDQASYQNAGQLLLDSWTHLFQGGVSGAVAIAYSPTYSPLLYYACPNSSLGIRANDVAHPWPLNAAQYHTLVNWLTKGAPDNQGNIPFASNPTTRQKIYLSQSGCNLVTVIDGQSKLVMRYIPVGSTVVASIHDVTVSGDGNYCYVSFYEGSWLQKIDTRTDSVVATADISSTALGGNGQWGILQMSPSDTAVVVSGFQASGNLVTLNTGSMTINTKMSEDVQNSGINANGLIFPHGIANNPTFDTFFVTLEYGNVVDRLTFNCHTGFCYKYVSIDGNPPVAASSAATLDPHQIQMTPDNNRYFVSCEKSNELRVMDAHADTLIKVIPVGPFPQEMTLCTSKNYLFVACLEDSVNRSQSPSSGNIGTVYVIDYNTYAVVKILAGDFNTPHDMAVDNQDGLLYVASENNYNGNGTPAHHVTACGGNAGWYTVYNLNTLQPADNIRYEVARFPYAISSRF